MGRKVHAKYKIRFSKRKLKKLKLQVTRHNIAEKENIIKRNNYSQRSKTKHSLINKYGTYCWLCGKDFGSKITHHHIIWKCEGGDDSEANGSLLCEKCQKRVHLLLYNSKEHKEIQKYLLNY